MTQSSRPPDHYALLGVERDATPEEIKRRFRQLARECHPDVAGADPDAHDRFTRLRAAYEVLADPEARKAYDHSLRPRVRRSHGPGAQWRPPGGHTFGGGPTPGHARPHGASDLDLEDLFGGGDFGFGQAAPEPVRGPAQSGEEPEPGPGRGLDDLDVHAHAALEPGMSERGGTLMVEYPRRVRAGAELADKDEIHALRVPPGARPGHTIRVPGWGHQEASGRAGDLYVRLSAAGPHVDRSEPAPAAGEARPLPISVGEAVLGGRVSVDTSTGPVTVTIPPGSSSGRRLRLAGRGDGGSDLFLEVRIAVPDTCDDESRELIRRFAERNPRSPREE